MVKTFRASVQSSPTESSTWSQWQYDLHSSVIGRLVDHSFSLTAVDNDCYCLQLESLQQFVVRHLLQLIGLDLVRRGPGVLQNDGKHGQTSRDALSGVKKISFTEKAAWVIDKTAECSLSSNCPVKF